ncbi:MAG TPA: hypothetical protein VMI31_09430 [Fimbriimonadaceae bacterium]|nr:hypothetical protein [Fimbriimonadaceae bacterium]
MSKFGGKPDHGTVEREWRHLNFWQYPTYSSRRGPQVWAKTSRSLRRSFLVRTVSGFTALFEARSGWQAFQSIISSMFRFLATSETGMLICSNSQSKLLKAKADC